MQHLESTCTPVLYVGRTVLKGESEPDDGPLRQKHVAYW
jgi:hypothetical protein